MKSTSLNSLAVKFFIFIFCALLSACTRDFSLTQKYSISGQVVDDKTGAPIMTGGIIKVDGYKSPAGMLDPGWKSNLGSGNIYPGGVFNFSFDSWSKATHYYFYFQYDNNSYINAGSIYLNMLALDASLFADGSFAVEIRAAKMTSLRINFRNISPFNLNDRVHISLPSPTDNILFGQQNPRWENLQFCALDAATGDIVGGTNARGSLTCTVPCDRKFSIRWKTKKNGVEQSFQDSVLCARDVTTVYTLDY